MQTLDQRALFAAVLAHPEEDTPRLMLADALEETDSARAELIRVQCELARLDDLEGITIGGKYSWEDYRKWSGLRDREAALLATHGARWRRVACVQCGGTGNGSLISSEGHGAKGRSVFAKCKLCNGTGDMGGLTWAIVPDLLPSGGIYKWNPPEVEFARGFPHVVCCARLADAVEQDLTTGVTTHTHYAATPWLAAVAKRHRTVEQVIPGDCDPEHGDLTATSYCWVRAGMMDPSPADLPAALFDMVAKLEPGWSGASYVVAFPTRELALAALGRAIVAFARKEPSA